MNILRLYNQNRLKVWTTIIVIIFIITIIQLLNSFYKQKNKEENKVISDTTEIYKNESKSLISDEEVSSAYNEDLAQEIDNFLSDCVNHNYNNAYMRLSQECKQKYPSAKIFENLYCKDKFEGNKEYSFQYWSSLDSNYTYQIKVFENMLATGKTNESNYIEDYITVVSEDGELKLNIDGYIGKIQLNGSNSDENDMLQINVKSVDQYMDYQIYNIAIKNKTDDVIILDTRNKTDKAYIIDSQGSKFDAFLYANTDKDLTIQEGEAKNIKIKFNVANSSNKNEIVQMVFEDIVKKVEYDQNENAERYKIVIDL